MCVFVIIWFVLSFWECFLAENRVYAEAKLFCIMKEISFSFGRNELYPESRGRGRRSHVFFYACIYYKLACMYSILSSLCVMYLNQSVCNVFEVAICIKCVGQPMFDLGRMFENRKAEFCMNL